MINNYQSNSQRQSEIEIEMENENHQGSQSDGERVIESESESDSDFDVTEFALGESMIDLDDDASMGSSAPSDHEPDVDDLAPIPPNESGAIDCTSSVHQLFQPLRAHTGMSASGGFTRSLEAQKMELKRDDCKEVAAKDRIEARSNRPLWFDGDENYSKRSLQYYLPTVVADAYKDSMGVNELYEWQSNCLHHENSYTLRGGNIIYSAPTSGGKTLVAEVLLFRFVMKYNLFRSKCNFNSSNQFRNLTNTASIYRALFIVPFNSLVQEKARDLQAVVRSMYDRLKCCSLDGNMCVTPDIDSPPLIVKAIDQISEFAKDSPIMIGVVTIEKGSMIINQMITEGRANEIGCVIIDECHLIGDLTRGYLLEHLIAKLRFIQRQRKCGLESKDSGLSMKLTLAQNREDEVPLQLIALSATLPNIEHLCQAIEATFFGHNAHRTTICTVK